MTTYSCQACSAPAIVINGSVIRGCTCTAPIIANIKAHATGTGGAAG